MSLMGHDCCLRLSVLVTNVGLAVGFSDHWNWETEAQCKGKPQHERGETAGAKLDQLGGDCSVFAGDPSLIYHVVTPILFCKGWQGMRQGVRHSFHLS